jgi:hypothetical protein
MKWTICIEDFEMTRTPQTVREEKEVEAPTAADAITIARLRYKIGAQHSTQMNPRQTEIVDVKWVEEHK